jgi:hypothetical protein
MYFLLLRTIFLF